MGHFFFLLLAVSLIAVSVVTVMVGGSLFTTWVALLSSTAGVVVPLLESAEAAGAYFLVQEGLSWLTISLSLLGGGGLDLALFLKLGLPPAHTWILVLIMGLQTAGSWVLSIGKLPMVLLVIATLGSDWGGLYFVSLVLAVSATFCVGGAIAIFFFSGAANTAWGLVVSMWSQLLGCMFLVVYLLTVYVTLPQSPMWGLVTEWGVLSLLGLPPSHVFTMKLSTAICVAQTSDVLGWFLLMSSVPLMLVYAFLWEARMATGGGSDWGAISLAVFLVVLPLLSGA